MILPWILFDPNIILGKSLQLIYIQEITSCQEEIRKFKSRNWPSMVFAGSTSNRNDPLWPYEDFQAGAGPR
jgi:hypothetical protein